MTVNRNRDGTLNFQNRVHKIGLKLTLKLNASAEHPSDKNLELEYLDTILFTGPDGTPTTSLDADVSGSCLSYDGFPELPTATYPGDGFGSDGPVNRRVAVDCESLGLGPDGTFWIGDEYGPYIYQFSQDGKMLRAIRPPDAYIPHRNDKVSFSSASPPIYDKKRVIEPEKPESGRNNNQGFEGLSISHDGKMLYALLQSALAQEGGKKKKTRRQTRLIVYDISDPGRIEYVQEHIVSLPLCKEHDGDKVVAGNSDILHIKGNQLLILARDSDAGGGSEETLSLFRQIDIFDISNATNIKSDHYDKKGGAIANEKGDLLNDIVPAQYFPFININDSSELARFKLHNGGDHDSGLLNEKWESLGLVPVDAENSNNGKDYFLFCLSDNDFITQHGRMNFGKFEYADSSGYELDNQVLVFHLTLPT